MSIIGAIGEPHEPHRELVLLPCEKLQRGCIMQAPQWSRGAIGRTMRNNGAEQQ